MKMMEEDEDEEVGFVRGLGKRVREEKDLERNQYQEILDKEEVVAKWIV